jgi:uncharacterized membrane-anchored protein
MKKYRTIVIVVNLVLLLTYFNYSIVKKEEILTDGQLVLLELAPVDPRSLMQGDYMALRYAIPRNIGSSEISKRGYCVIQLDSNKIARKVRLQADVLPLSEKELLIKYTMPDGWGMNIGAESYFFQEGQGVKYEKAKYGGVKIDPQGNSVLVGLYDKDRRIIE